MSLDLNAIQEDDQISKVELAHEIERTRQQFHESDQELSTQVDLIKQTIDLKIATLLTDVNKALILKKEEVGALIVTARKNLQDVHNSSFQQIKDEVKKYTASIEEEMQSVREDAKKLATAEVDRYLKKIFMKVELLSSQTIDFKNVLAKQTEAYQVETRNKISTQTMEFNAIKDKFLKLAKLLA